MINKEIIINNVISNNKILIIIIHMTGYNLWHELRKFHFSGIVFQYQTRFHFWIFKLKVTFKIITVVELNVNFTVKMCYCAEIITLQGMLNQLHNKVLN